MRIVIQRVKSAGVSVNGGVFSTIGEGLVLFVGLSASDDEKTAAYMAEKTANLRIFDDDDGCLNRSVIDCNGECLAISNFTLYANCRKGRRPSFTEAAPKNLSEPLYAFFVKALKDAGIKTVKDGAFGADMQVDLRNDGPVTVILDSDAMM